MSSIDLLQSLPNFVARFGTDEACRAHLFALRWPEGFSCRRCAGTGYYAHSERIIYECSQCGTQHSLLADTFFEQTKIALAKWFLAIYLFIGSKGAISGAEFKRQLGFKSDQTAWATLHKLRGTLRLRAQPSGAVEVDTAFRDAIECLFQDKGKGPGLEKTRISDEVRLKVVTRTAKEKPGNATHWSARILAQEMGLGHSTVQRIWNEYGLKPHLTRSFKLSNDPKFVEKIVDIVGLYLEPPEHAVVLSVDEKRQIRALDRTQPGLPVKKRLATTITHDHKFNGSVRP